MTLSDSSRAESLRQRLRNRITDRREDPRFGLQRYAVERFLYCLGESPYRTRFILKGATLFAIWGGPVYRPTRDLDFTGYGSAKAEDVLAALREVCLCQGVPDTGMTFDPGSLSAEAIRDDSDYGGLRIRLDAMVGKSRIRMLIDIGFANAIEPPAGEVEYPTLLGDPAPHILAYPPEAVIAEKLHAVVVLGERNSRLKDFYDLHALARQFAFDGKRLMRAIGATFHRRRTSIDTAVPLALTPRFYDDASRASQWRTYLSRNELPGPPADFSAVGEVIRLFLLPPWQALAGNATFDESWPAGGPWSANYTIGE